MSLRRSAKESLETLSKSMVSVAIGLSLGALLAYFAGENPVHVLRVILNGAFGTEYDRGMVVYFASILIATGLAVAIPFQAGIFNIGAEGQILVGALACAVLGIYSPEATPVWISVSLGFLVAMLASAIWGAIAGAIRAYFGGHEVIGSIMLNFIAAGLTGWLVVDRLQSIDSQNPETAMIQAPFRLAHFEMFAGAPASAAIFVALGAAFLFWLVLERSQMGLQIKTVRQSPDAARIAGFSVPNVRFWSFCLGSAMCGIAGAAMVLGEAGRFRVDMSEGFGFLGIPVALLGKGRPFGIVLAAFLFASLHHGASSLDLEAAKVSRDLAQVIEALVVLCVIALPDLMSFFKKSIHHKNQQKV